MVFTLPKAAEGTTHKKGENKSWASAAAFARRLLLECLTFTPIKILFLTYLLKVSPHKLNGSAHNELKRGKKVHFGRTAMYCLPQRLKSMFLEKKN